MPLENFVISTIGIPILRNEDGEELEADYRQRISGYLCMLLQSYSASAGEAFSFGMSKDVHALFDYHLKQGWNKWLDEDSSDNKVKTAEDYKSETIWTPEKDGASQSHGDFIHWKRIDEQGNEKQIHVHLFKYYDFLFDKTGEPYSLSGVVLADLFNPAVFGKISRVTGKFVNLLIGRGINATGDVYYKKHIAHFPEPKKEDKS